jgi:trans-aconitate 2-methyltransferase
LRHINKGSWDARTYDQVSRLVQYRWGKQVLEWRKWIGNEIVMDAGCGSGLLTKQLAKKVPQGKVYAIDIDSNMIKQAKNNLQLFDNVEIMQSSFADIKLPRKMDVIFSNSALHWIQDHRKAFQNFWKMLKPMNSDNGADMSIGSNINNTSISGQLLIQCGGYGNLQQIITMLERITHLDQFREYFADWKQPWYFAKPEDTNKMLQETGYVNTTVYSNSDCVILPNRQIYSKFVKTVVMKPYLDYLSQHNDEIDKLKTLFLEVFLDEVEKRSNKSNTNWFLDFVRLNIIAHRS